MKQSEIRLMADELEGLTYQIGMVRNYLSTLSLTAVLDEEPAQGVFYSLTQDRGLTNMERSLETIQNKIDKAAIAMQEILDSYEKKGVSE
ncbi:hypothetical protein [Enterococcus sp. AZ196]|uniref:hypothetical protein n=1 Tax=Enterococcus sp. AZ196 TaxID=2774659 RepID=UPI003D270CF2